MLKITWTVEKRNLTDLKDWGKNPRTITSQDFELLKESVQERGFHDVLKIDTDGTIISGHQRKKVLMDLGIVEVNVMVPDRPLTEKERDIIAVESNKHRGKFDFDILANHFDVGDLLTAGFTEIDLGMVERPDIQEKESEGGGEADAEMMEIKLVFPKEEIKSIKAQFDYIQKFSKSATLEDTFRWLLYHVKVGQ